MTYISTQDLPVIDRAGYFKLENATFDFCYRGPTHVLHLYEYDTILNVDGHTLSLRSGDVSCIPAGRIYSYETEAPGSHWCIHFKDELNESVPGFTLPMHLPLARRGIQLSEQFRLISHLHNFPAHRAIGKSLSNGEAQFRLKALLFQLANLKHSPKPAQKAVQDTINWDLLSKMVDDQLSGLVTTARLAAQLNLPPARLARRFKQHFGCTVSQYLLVLRIERARSLLTTSNMSIQEIGASVGIPDPQHFNKRFRKVVGQSPSRYRDDNRQLLAQASSQVTTRDGRWRDKTQYN